MTNSRVTGVPSSRPSAGHGVLLGFVQDQARLAEQIPVDRVEGRGVESNLDEAREDTLQGRHELVPGKGEGREDGKCLYLIEDGIPNMLIDERIDL